MKFIINEIAFADDGRRTATLVTNDKKFWIDNSGGKNEDETNEVELLDKDAVIRKIHKAFEKGSLESRHQIKKNLLKGWEA